MKSSEFMKLLNDMKEGKLMHNLEIEGRCDGIYVNGEKVEERNDKRNECAV